MTSTRTCPECGAPVIRKEGRGGVKTFCCPEHKTAFQSRQALEGRAIIALAKAWREARNRREDREVGAAALAEMCRIIDGFNAQDRAAGRPRTTEYVRRDMARGYAYQDRRKRS